MKLTLCDACGDPASSAKPVPLYSLELEHEVPSDLCPNCYSKLRRIFSSRAWAAIPGVDIPKPKCFEIRDKSGQSAGLVWAHRTMTTDGITFIYRDDLPDSSDRVIARVPADYSVIIRSPWPIFGEGGTI